MSIAIKKDKKGKKAEVEFQGAEFQGAEFQEEL